MLTFILTDRFIKQWSESHRERIYKKLEALEAILKEKESKVVKTSDSKNWITDTIQTYFSNKSI